MNGESARAVLTRTAALERRIIARIDIRVIVLAMALCIALSLVSTYYMIHLVTTGHQARLDEDRKIESAVAEVEAYAHAQAREIRCAIVSAVPIGAAPRVDPFLRESIAKYGCHPYVP